MSDASCRVTNLPASKVYLLGQPEKLGLPMNVGNQGVARSVQVLVYIESGHRSLIVSYVLDY